MAQNLEIIAVDAVMEEMATHIHTCHGIEVCLAFGFRRGEIEIEIFLLVGIQPLM
jgi:hypothetical protein